MPEARLKRTRDAYRCRICCRQQFNGYLCASCADDVSRAARELADRIDAHVLERMQTVNWFTMPPLGCKIEG